MEKKIYIEDETEPPDEDTEPPSGEAAFGPVSTPELGQKTAALPSSFLPRTRKPHRLRPKNLNAAARFTCSPQSDAFRKRVFPGVSVNEWNDWHWQLRNRILNMDALERIIDFSREERSAIEHSNGLLPLAITPYYASLLDAADPMQPLRRTVVPVAAEYFHRDGEEEDPLGEEKDSPVPGIVHRYPDRVLFLVTGYCSTYCRYCTRSRMVGNGHGTHFNVKEWERAIAYIEGTPAIRDVLLSGGDPLTLSNDRLEWLLSRLRRIPHVEFIRIGTKMPVVLPQRVTPSLTRMLKRFHPLWMSIHFTHPDELTPEVNHACTRLADAGIPLGSQTVLLAGVNDSVETMKHLVHGLLKMRVKPYYLYQCDPIPGSSHFRTPVEKGLEIIHGLRGFTTGYAVPAYVIDAPAGGGKIPLLPEYVVGRDGDDLLLRNYQGNIYRYPDPGGSIGNFPVERKSCETFCESSSGDMEPVL
ncbi:KamA family radical SAM protein [Desulforhabdus amnigena]|jgi:lysine 2,3-aminomutase|uniref:L-lysine 2,3-aminomutase n=1 Tax=Desulforhabdus amnigena TaxID=40218 RepID=A0A9W6D443_9BACT|nr:KamA family radical SAM protein [Desulforhabdus amnigena]GLI33822.1 L-lysine 2,3-aminomutase [Desulforhabdus amnigena]